MRDSRHGLHNSASSNPSVPPEEVQLHRKIWGERIKYQIGRKADWHSPWLKAYDNKLARESADPELIRVQSPVAFKIGKVKSTPPYSYQDMFKPVYEESLSQYAKDTSRHSTTLSRGEHEDVYAKLMDDRVLKMVPVYPGFFDHEDTLPIRINLIKTLIEQELGPHGFSFDKALSSVKHIVYSKPFQSGFKLFVSTARSGINPAKRLYEWEIEFAFGLQSVTGKWPSHTWVDTEECWSFRTNWFLPERAIYESFRVLPQLETCMRFNLFAYKLIADEFESALRAGFAEAEAAGLLSESQSPS
jgi:hypothetical protein